MTHIEFGDGSPPARTGGSAERRYGLLPRRLALLALGASAAACVSVPQGLTTATVTAARETQAVASAQDAADDPAIWRNSADPSASLIVATDKQAGLYVYGLDGRARSMLAAGQVNNVDLRAGVDMGGPGGAMRGVLVGASDRTDLAQGRIALFRLDTAAATLIPLASLPVAPGEAYGFCLWRRASDNTLFAFLIMKDGAVVQAQLDLSGASPLARVVRTVKLGTQAEGCAADDRTGLVYVAEEDVGVWLIDADPNAPPMARPFAKVDGRQLFADAEGVAIVPSGADAGLLLVSSQGDSAYAAYQLNGGGFAGRFRIGASASIDGTSDTDGIEVALGDFGPDFPDGVLIAQDGDNAPDAQNFKIVPWAEVSRALGPR